jgi:hypothetical protein
MGGVFSLLWRINLLKTEKRPLCTTNFSKISDDTYCPNWNFHRNPTRCNKNGYCTYQEPKKSEVSI